MKIQITNQRPAEIYRPHEILPKIDITLTADEYVEELSEHLKTNIVDPMFIPLNAQTNVLMEDVTDSANPIAFDDDAILNGIWHLWTDDIIDPNLDAQLTDIYYQSLRYSQDNNWRIENQQAQEVLTKFQMPLPSSGTNGRMVTYTPQLDIIPMAKNLLSNTTDSSLVEEWFATMSGYIYNRMTDITLITVQSGHVWNRIKQHVDQVRQSLNQQGALGHDINKLLTDFDNINLDGELSAGVFLPENGAEDPYSFNRIIMNIFANYEENHNDELFVQPINTMELLFPRNLIVLNLEEYAHATSAEIAKDWDDLEQAFMIKNKLNIVSNKKLMTAKAVNASTQPSGGKAMRKSNDPLTRRQLTPFSQKPITSRRMLDLMKNVIMKTTTNKQTDNTYRSYKKSYMRPNRRDPNNINLMGKLSTTSYRPDIHIYLDTSGSIDEKQYRDAVASIILLTKQIDANLYISSFSHYITQTTLLKTKDKPSMQIYKDFLNIPKAHGGTEYENVWNKIDQLDIMNERVGKSYQLNFVITDFEYGLRRDRKFASNIASHKHTYYVPISTDINRWKSTVRNAKRFMEEMANAGAKGIRNHLLM